MGLSSPLWIHSVPLPSVARDRPRGGGGDRIVRASGGARAVLPELSAGALATALVAGSTWWIFDLPASYPWIVTGTYAGLALLIERAARPAPPGAVEDARSRGSESGRPVADGAGRRRGLGWGNRVTLLRAALVLPVAAVAAALTLAGEGPGGDPRLRWWGVGVSLLALLLDGVDGYVARRTQSETAFGARFDMEVDAALLLVLSALVFELDRAGPWVLGIGGMRYAFVAAGAAVPALRAPLPPSLRRKVICVLQGSALALALSPVAGATIAAPVLAGALAALGASFLLDTVLLLRRPRPSW